MHILLLLNRILMFYVHYKCINIVFELIPQYFRDKRDFHPFVKQISRDSKTLDDISHADGSLKT